MAYNPRRNILGAISLGSKVAYHLFKIDAGTSQPMRFCRKSKWYVEFCTSSGINIFSFGNQRMFFRLIIDESITSLDFDPTGEFAAMTSDYATCVVSDITTNDTKFSESSYYVFGNFCIATL